MALKPLNCTRCGAPLKDPPQNELIRCGYCGQNHHFDPDSEPPPAPPPPAAVPMMPVGMFKMWMVPLVLGAMGMLSTIVLVLLTKEPTPGPGAAAAGVVTPASDGPGDAAATYRDGEAVEVWWGSQWWKGTVKRVNGGGSYHVGYDGWSSSWDEDVTARRLRRRGAP